MAGALYILCPNLIGQFGSALTVGTRANGSGSWHLPNGPSADKPIGEVTSGNLSPILQKGIGLGYVTNAYSQIGTPLAIDIRGRAVPAIVVKPPFYKRPSVIA